MPQKKFADVHRKSISLGLKTVTAAVASAMLVSSVHAAGLGKLTVLSSLGQPLNAEIELSSVSKDEAGSLAVKLASQEAYRQANVEFNPALLSLRFSVEQRSGRRVIRVTSSQPINEPFVDMLLEVGGQSSHLVREYTFLLDPADLRKAQPAQLAATAPQSKQAGQVSKPAAQPNAMSRPGAAEKPVPAANAPQQAGPAPTGEEKEARKTGDYQVKNGDTLANIATQVKPEGVSLDQMLVALQRANPHAFLGQNINRLRSGQILTLPDADTARAIDKTEARTIVLAQAADFQSYRSKLASQVGDAAPQKSEDAGQSAGGKITTKVEEQANGANEAKDRLKLSKSGATGADGGKTAGPVGTEDKIAKEKALAEANARVRELEKNVSDLQKLLEFKNKELADRQKQAMDSKAASAATATTPAAAPAVPAAPAPASSTPAASSSSAPQAPAAAAPATSTEAPQPAAAAAPGPDAAKPDAPAPKPAAAPVKRKAVLPPPRPEPSIIDTLLDNPLLLSVLGIGAAALAGLGIYSNRRRKQRKEFEDSNILTDSGLKTNSLFGTSGGQSVDTNNSVFNSNFAPSASQLDANEVDPVAEADVYIAYGRDAQAEEILKEALHTQPERNAVRLKLLEIYANRKDLRAFETVATELYSMTKGQGEEWKLAASLGISIDPKNPLYAGGKPVNVAAVKAAGAASPKEPLDEIDLDALLNTTQGSGSMALDPEISGDASDDGETAASNINAMKQAAAPAVQKMNGLASELTSAVSLPPTAKASAPTASPEPDISTNTLDFDFDLPGLGIKDEPAPASAENTSLPELNSATGGLDFDFQPKKPKTSPSDAASRSPDFSSDATSENHASPSIDVPAGSAQNAQNTAYHDPLSNPGSLDFDLSGINLDLNPVEDIKSSDMQDVPPLESSNSQSNVAEMATKLDLALAYQEIGDKEGARELLDEVVAGGNNDQVEKARSMLLQLA